MANFKSGVAFITCTLFGLRGGVSSVKEATDDTWKPRHPIFEGVLGKRIPENICRLASF
jgi:hypothetical protein